METREAKSLVTLIRANLAYILKIGAGRVPTPFSQAVHRRSLFPPKKNYLRARPFHCENEEPWVNL